MSFVGTRPEAVKYVKKYKAEYMATLLLPAGITSEASIRYKDEAELEKASLSFLASDKKLMINCGSSIFIISPVCYCRGSTPYGSKAKCPVSFLWKTL